MSDVHFDIEVTKSNLHGFTEAIVLIEEALIDAGHHIFIKAHTMNHPIFINEKFVQTLKEKLINSKRFICQILVDDLRTSKSNSEFVRNYQRLTDYIEIRHFKPEHTNADRRQYLIIDNDFLAWQNYDKRHDMRIFSDKHRVRDFSDSFKSEWNNSSRDLSLLNLYI